MSNLIMTTTLTPSPKPTREFAISVLTGIMREAADNLPDDIASMPVSDLEDIRKPTEIDHYLRKNLWKQVEIAQKAGIVEIQPVQIYSGICSKQNYERIAKTPLRLAWMLTPPTEDIARLEAGLSLGLTNLLKFVAKEPTAETAGAFLKAIEFLYNRVHGPMVQRVDARHAHVNLNKPMASPTPKDDTQRLEEIKQKLALDQRDVTPKVSGE